MYTMQRCQVMYKLQQKKKYKDFVTLLYYFFGYRYFSGVIIFLSTFYFYSLHFQVIICTFYSLHFSNSLVTRILFLLFSSFINRVNLIVIGWGVSTYTVPIHYWSVHDQSPLHVTNLTPRVLQRGPTPPSSGHLVLMFLVHPTHLTSIYNLARDLHPAGASSLFITSQFIAALPAFSSTSPSVTLPACRQTPACLSPNPCLPDYLPDAESYLPDWLPVAEPSPARLPLAEAPSLSSTPCPNKSCFL